MKRTLCFSIFLTAFSWSCSKDSSTRSGTSDNEAIAENVLVSGELQLASSVCPNLDALRNTETDAGPALNKCLGEMKNGGTLALTPGAYTIATQIVLSNSKTLTTLGKTSAAPCSAEPGHGCAELRAAAGLVATFGILNMYGPSMIDHMVLNGRKDIRAAARALCQADVANNLKGFNGLMTGPNLKFTNSASINAACGSGMAVDGTDVVITSSSFAYNGTHGQGLLHADGLTLLQGLRMTIVGNTFRNNTDVDLITGGIVSSRVAFNSITHDGSYASSAYTALMIQAFTSTDGNHAGTVFENNYIDCGPGMGCGFGILVGSTPWYFVKPVYGGFVRNNAVVNAQGGIAVMDDVVLTQIGDNDVSASGNVTCNTEGNMRVPYFAFSYTDGTLAQFVGKRVGINQYVKAPPGYSFKIPNSAPGQCSAGATVPPPNPELVGRNLGQSNCGIGYGRKTFDGNCLPSCGLLAGAGAQVVRGSCSRGYQNAGNTFDAGPNNVCCGIPGAPPARGRDICPVSIEKNQSLYATERICNGQYSLNFQPDGNATIFGSAGMKYNFNTRNGTTLTLQDDGNLVMYAGASVPPNAIWTSGTSGLPVKSAVIQDDGNLVLMSKSNTPCWSAYGGLVKPSCGGSAASPPAAPPAPVPVPVPGCLDRLIQNQGLAANDRLCFGDKVAVFQSDGNLTTHGPQGLIFNAGTGAINASLLMLGADGNLVMYRSDGSPYWSSRTSYPSQVRRHIITAVLQNDGNFVLVANDGTPCWSIQSGSTGQCN